MAFFFARRRAPTAIVTESTVGIATGIAATVSTRANCSVVKNGSPRMIETMTITLTIATARMIRYVPILSTARWKWLMVWLSWTSSAVLPK